MTDNKDDDREEKFRVMSREKALAVLIEVTDTLDSTGNVYWLSDGTLLGLVREGDFIAHDDDIDIVVLASSFNPEAIHQLIAKGFVINQLFGTLEKGFGLTMRRDGIRVDWFMCYEKDGQHVYSIFQQISRHRGQRLDYVYPIVQRKKQLFLGHEFYVPEDPEAYTETQYGPYWKMPNKIWNSFIDPHNIVYSGEFVNFGECTKQLESQLGITVGDRK